MHRKTDSLFSVLKMRSNSPAFTIVELLVVIVVIGILAAITIVSYGGVSSRANIANMQAELSNASKKLNLYYIDNSAYPLDLTAAKTAKLIPSATKTNETYTVNNTTNPPYYCYMYREGAETYAIDSLSGPSRGACLTNLITNGDFSGGTSGWFASQGTITVSAGIISNTANGGVYYSETDQTCNNCAIVDHKIYAIFKQMVTNSNATGLGINISDPVSNKSWAGISNPTINTWYTNSGIVTFTGTGNITFKPNQQYADAATANGKVMQIKYVSAIDLTATFGAGNEPTKAQMDTIMNSYTNSWLNGTKKGNL